MIVYLRNRLSAGSKPLMALIAAVSLSTAFFTSQNTEKANNQTPDNLQMHLQLEYTALQQASRVQNTPLDDVALQQLATQNTLESVSYEQVAQNLGLAISHWVFAEAVQHDSFLKDISNQLKKQSLSTQDSILSWKKRNLYKAMMQQALASTQRTTTRQHQALTQMLERNYLVEWAEVEHSHNASTTYNIPKSNIQAYYDMHISKDAPRYSVTYLHILAPNPTSRELQSVLNEQREQLTAPAEITIKTYTLNQNADMQLDRHAVQAKLASKSTQPLPHTLNYDQVSTQTLNSGHKNYQRYETINTGEYNLESPNTLRLVTHKRPKAPCTLQTCQKKLIQLWKQKQRPLWTKDISEHINEQTLLAPEDLNALAHHFNTSALTTSSDNQLLPKALQAEFTGQNTPQTEAIMPPIATEQGVIVYKINSIHPGQKPPLSQVRPQIIATLKQEQFRQESQSNAEKLSDTLKQGSLLKTHNQKLKKNTYHAIEVKPHKTQSHSLPKPFEQQAIQAMQNNQEHNAFAVHNDRGSTIVKVTLKKSTKPKTAPKEISSAKTVALMLQHEAELENIIAH